MPWIVFGDFNEITKSDEKIGWLEFRDCLNRCELYDLGFSGQKVSILCSFLVCGSRQRVEG